MGIVEIILLALGTYWVADAMNIHWIWAAPIIATVYMMVTKGKGISGLGFGVFGGVQQLFAGILRFGTTLAVWVGVMMIGTKVIIFSNNSASTAFYKLGWSFWL